MNVRMLAATNKPLEAMVKEKTFREDLYYRLNVVRIQLPPLRERMEDVPQLVDFVLKRLARDSKADAKAISPEALAVLARYSWPGNVRELENLVYRSAVMAQGEMILVKDLPQEVVAAIENLPIPEPAVEVVEAVAADGLPASVAAPQSPPDGSIDAVDAVDVVDTVVGAPAAEPFDAVYAKLRADQGTNILEHAEREIIARALGSAVANRSSGETSA